MNAALEAFGDPGPFTDVVLLVERRKLHVSKAVLGVSSKVFERMFQSNFREKTAIEIPLPDKKCSDIVEFLLCLYPSTMKAVSNHNVAIVLKLADEYQVESLRERCNTFLCESCKEPTKLLNEDLVKFLMLADKYNLPAALDSCISIATTRSVSDLRYMHGFDEISAETKYRLLSKRTLLLEPAALDVNNIIGDFISDVEDILYEEECTCCKKNEKCLKCTMKIKTKKLKQCLDKFSKVFQ